MTGARMRGVRLWIVAAAAATLVGLLEATQVHLGVRAVGRDYPWLEALQSTLPSWYLFALLLPGVLWVARRWRLDREHWRRALLAHVPAAVLFTLVHLSGSAYVSDVLLDRGGEVGVGVLLMRALSFYFVMDLLVYAGVVGAYYAVDYYAKFRERAVAASQLESKASRLEASLAQANLQALRMQLNPHFLFNTLNAVSVLAMKGENDAVVRMLSRLSELLRLTLENNAQVVPLEEELRLLDRYLAIEQVRFHDRLTVETEVAGDVLEAEVPSLILQPLVENAIKHGIAARACAGRVTIRARRENGTLHLQVADTGPGPSGSSGGGGGVGLSNTRARLEQLYGDAYRFELTDAAEGGAVAQVSIPFRSFQVS